MAVATFALTTAVAATAGTVAHADDYPPVKSPPAQDSGVVPPAPAPPPPPPGQAGSNVVVAAPVPMAPGALPATGSSGVSTTLIAGGLALLLGVGLTTRSVVGDRRRSPADDSAA